MSVSSNTQPAAQPDQLRTIPLSRVVVAEDFNPREEVQRDAEFDALVESIRKRGVTQPIRVRPGENGEYVVIAGERRYLAAIEAAVTEIPASVRMSDGEDRDLDELTEAIEENDLRVGLTPLDRARGYQRYLDKGKSVKGICETLANVTPEYVRSHLRILKLSEDVQAKVGDGTIPMRAVKALEALAKVHPGLPGMAVHGVVGKDAAYEFSWADVERDALAVALVGGAPLPEGVYEAHERYPLASFALSEKSLKAVAQIAKLRERPLEYVVLSHAEIEQARVLKAAHGNGRHVVIVGSDVATQLVEDAVARELKDARAYAKRVSEARRAMTATSATSTAAADVTAEQRAQAEAQAKKAQREQDKARRLEATRFNLALGHLLVNTVSRVKVDDRTLKLLASVNVTGSLSELATRGARYGFPGWVQEGQAKNGNATYGYIEQSSDTANRAHAYLAAATSAGEVAGRQIALVAMAVFADQEAVAQSRRTWHEVKPVGPWAEQFDQLLDAVLTERTGDRGVAVLGPILTKRAEHRRAHSEATARLEGVEDRIAAMDGEALDQVKADVKHSGQRYSQHGNKIELLVAERRRELKAKAEQAASVEPPAEAQADTPLAA